MTERNERGSNLDDDIAAELSTTAATSSRRSVVVDRSRVCRADRIALVRLWYRFDGDVRKVLRHWRAKGNVEIDVDAGVRKNNETATVTTRGRIAEARDNASQSPQSRCSPEHRRRRRRRHVSGRTVRETVRRFHELGNVCDRSRSGRRRSVRTDVSIERVRESILRDPTLSTRKRAKALNISRSSLMRIQRLDLHVRPYKLQLAHQLLPIDTVQRCAFATRLLHLATHDRSLVHRLIMGDEAHFDVSGAVFNRQNVRFWGTENPRLVRPRALHTVRVTAWCGVSSVGILGPYFFESPAGANQSVTGERYRRMLLDYVEPLLRTDRRYSRIRDWWWQQDGASSHTAKETMAILRRVFGKKRLISRGADFPWPPRSPDLSAADFFLWGYLKDRVYRIERDVASGGGATPLSQDELKRAIVREVALLNDSSNDELRRSVMAGVIERARMCALEQGRHLRDVIFHTR